MAFVIKLNTIMENNMEDREDIREKRLSMIKILRMEFKFIDLIIIHYTFQIIH